MGYIELLKSLISKQSDFNLGSQKFMQHGGAPSTGNVWVCESFDAL